MPRPALSRIRARRHRHAERRAAARPRCRYSSGLDVLRQTPGFIEDVRRTRLDGEFAGAYSYLESLFNGRNPYMEAIQRNLDYLGEVLRTGRWPMLRRDPPCFTWERNPVQNIRSLVIGHLKQVWKKQLIDPSRRRARRRPAHRHRTRTQQGTGPRRAVAGRPHFHSDLTRRRLGLWIGGCLRFHRHRRHRRRVRSRWATCASFAADPGLTTEIAMVVTCLLGGLAMREPRSARRRSRSSSPSCSRSRTCGARLGQERSDRRGSARRPDARRRGAGHPAVGADEPIDPWGVRADLRKLWMLAVLIMAINAARIYRSARARCEDRPVRWRDCSRASCRALRRSARWARAPRASRILHQGRGRWRGGFVGRDGRAAGNRRRPGEHADTDVAAAFAGGCRASRR